MISENFIYFGLALHFIGQIIYLVSITRGHAKPNLVSWVIWTLAPMIGAFFEFKGGAGLSALPVFMAGFGPFLVVLFSSFIKNAYWKLSAFDLYCGALSLIALACYVFTRNLAISLLFVISSDALASLPTIVKAWKFPDTESSPIYFFAMTSNIIGLLAIKTWSFSASAFGISLVLQCVIILFCIYHTRIFGLAKYTQKT